MDTGVKIAVTALCAVVLLTVLKKNGREFSVPVVLVTGGCVVYYAMGAMAKISAAIVRFSRLAQIELWVVEPVIKVVGISLIAKLAGEVCRGAGETGIAAFVDTAGTILSLGCTIPLAQAVVDMVVEMLA